MTQKMKENPHLAQIPVVIVSAEPNAGRIDQLKRDGVRGHLAKPFTPEGFREILEQTLGVTHA